MKNIMESGVEDQKGVSDKVSISKMEELNLANMKIGKQSRTA